MGEFFKSNDYMRTIYKHKNLPVYVTDEFDFYRCVEFNESFYGKSVYDLHAGNLRECTGRYSKLFPNQRISYWADSPDTSRAEIKKHGASNNIITFWAYDDATSTIPITDNDEPLIIIDGRKCGVQELIDKIDNGIALTLSEENMMKRILEQKPDCLVYDSRAYKGGENYIFLERGFKKLAVRQLRLRLGNRKAKNSQTIVCADTSDYMPFVANYGCCLEPIARVGLKREFLESEQYKYYMKNHDISADKLRSAFRD
ncbi:hypothetical protein [Butyrivibrio sp. M55]|uniref:hypothetical protein n=1 Tax=Butyrivibrio sp. M55 TaxID=1855323 RepID=UPI0008E87A3B|nr:hypothetical protein [Butyrivibrio sp. M55]SFU75126.1 hypothetical protein SAMN05216540_10863 [Butyrivibrio sp. M55]